MSFDDDMFDAERGERYNPKTDQWLPGGDPRLPKYRGVERQRVGFGYGLPITAPRGGIKYPTPKKETHMPERMTKAQIEHELRTNTQLMDALRYRRKQLQEQAAKAIPAEPHNFTMFTIAVKFSMRGNAYQFMVLRSGGKYYTTGTKAEHAVFASWEKFCEWLEGPDVYSHSDLEILRSAGNAVSFTSGAIERLDPAGQPPF